MRIKALLLALILLFSCVPVSAYEAETDDMSFQHAQSFLSQLEISEGINKQPDELIDRAGFTAMIIRALNYQIAPTDTSAFIDCKDNPFSKEIYMAKDVGIVNGTSPVTFSPDAAITTVVAAKMLVSALGYGEKAEALGGYPYGYLKVANSLELFEGTDSGSELVTTGDSFILIYNMLYADKAIISSVIDNELVFEQIEGRNLLTENFGFSLVSGVVTTAGFYGTDLSLTGKGKIGIGTHVFSSDIENVHNLIGYSAKIWYNSSEKKAYAVDLDSVNKAVSYNAYDFMGYQNNTISVDDGTNKGKNYRCDSLTFIENGASVPFTVANFNFENGEITLIDNDGDGKIEYAVAKRGEYFIIKSKNVIDTSIYDGNSSVKTVVFEENDDCNYSVFIDGQEADFDDLKPGMSTQVYVRYDGKYSEIVAVTERLTANVTEIADDGVFLDGEKYKLNSYFTSKGNKLSPGKTYKLYIAPDGTITDIDYSVSGDERYGMCLGLGIVGGLSGVTKIKLLTTEDEVKIFEFEDRFLFDGNRIDNTDSLIKTTLVDTATNIPNYQLVKYKVSDNGKISMIDTAISDESRWDVEAPKPENNTLTRYIWNKELYYREGYANPHVYMLNAVMFKVPEDFDLKDPLQQVKKKYDDDDFSVLTSASLGRGEIVDVDAFDFDENFVPQAILVRKAESNMITVDHPSYIVTKVSVNALTEDGELAVKLYTFRNGKHEEVFVKPEDWASYSQKPQNGDVIRFITGKDGYVSAMHIAVHFKGMNEAKKAEVNYTTPVNSKVHGSLTYITGTVYNVSDSFIVLNESIESGGTYWFKAPTGTLSLPLSNPEYVLYNQKALTAKTVSSDKLISSLHAGTAGSSFVVCECYYGRVARVYIYEY